MGTGETQIKYVCPIDAMLIETPVPLIEGPAWGDVGSAYINCTAAVRKCNEEKAAALKECRDAAAQQ